VVLPVIVDTHCHLDFQSFEADREGVLERAWMNGLVRVLNPGIDPSSSQAVLRIADRYDQVYAAVGVHPNDADCWTDETRKQLRQLASHPKVVAIGEIGLDYYHKKVAQEIQHRAFEEQLELATELDLPVILHNRESSIDLLSTLSAWVRRRSNANQIKKRPRGVLHSFSGSLENAHQAISMGFMIGLSGPITFQNAKALREIVAKIPLEAVLVETDAPFLTPHPHRGKRNEPAHVRLIVEKLAEIYSLPIEEIATITTANANNLFKW
jgi:TatD DNase family protein